MRCRSVSTNLQAFEIRGYDNIKMSIQQCFWKYFSIFKSKILANKQFKIQNIVHDLTKKYMWTFNDIFFFFKQKLKKFSKSLSNIPNYGSDLTNSN